MMITGRKSGGKTYHPYNQIPHRPDELEDGQSGHTPQHNRHIDRGALVLRRIRVAVEGLQPRGAQHHRRQGEVAEHPGQDDRTAETLVVVGLPILFGDGGYLLRGLGRELGQLGFVLRVEIAVVLGDVDVDLAAGLQVGGRQFLGLVVALGAPGDVVGVAEGVDVQDVDVGGREEDVLDELFLGQRVRSRGADLILTLVNMCQGSRKMKEARNHITYVEPRETMIEKNW